MKKLLLSVAAAVMTVIGLGSVAAISPAAYATNAGDQFLGSVTPSGMPGGSDAEDGLLNIVQTIINVIIGVVGIIAVVMMIVGGISFITSQGDTNKVTKARNTILYGVVGLIVALLAFAIVNFVLSSLFTE